MAEQATAEKLKVFISYSRNDVQFADELAEGLMLTDFDPLIIKGKPPALPGRQQKFDVS